MNDDTIKLMTNASFYLGEFLDLLEKVMSDNPPKMSGPEEDAWFVRHFHETVELAKICEQQIEAALP